MLKLTIHRPHVRPLAGGCTTLLAVLSLTGCGVQQLCFGPDDCLRGWTCDTAGSGGNRGKCIPAADASVQPIRCPIPGMVNVANLVCMDIYEASRPDATRDSAGKNNARATNRKGVLPWQVKDNAEAAAACKAAGKRLCTAGEWQKACQGPEGTVYVYGDTYEPKTCNGIDAFPNWDFHLAPTGDFPKCTNVYGVKDINGNLWEHIKDGSEMLVRGGAYNCSDSSALHKCAYIPGNWAPSALGFRCCADGMPEGVDAGPLLDLPPIPDLGPAPDTAAETSPAAEAGPPVDLNLDGVVTH